MESLVPQLAFRIEHRTEHRRSEVSKIEDLDGDASSHFSLAYSLSWTRRTPGQRQLLNQRTAPHDGAQRHWALRSLCHD